MSRRRVVVTGVGAVTAAGIGYRALQNALRDGRPCTRPIEAFDASTFPVREAAEVPELRAKQWVERRKDIKLLSRDSLLAVGAARELLASVGNDALGDDPFSVGLYLGVGLEEGDPLELARPLAPSVADGRIVPEQLAAEGMGQMNPLASLKTLPNMALGHIAIQCGVRGPNLALSPFDDAGAQAIAEATDAIRDGQIDVALAGGADAKVSMFGITTFSRLGVLARAESHGDPVPPPFDVRRRGALLGEGAVVLLLEDAERARARGAQVLGEILGTGAGSSPDPVGPPQSSEGFLMAIKAALADAGVSAREVAAVHPAACGTASGDHAESVAILEALGAAPRVFSSKPVVGETFAAAAAVGVAAALTARADGQIIGPETFGMDVSTPVRMGEAAGTPLDDGVLLVNSGALGGGCTCLVLGGAS